MTNVVIDRSAGPGWAGRAWDSVAAARPRLMSSAQIAQALADSERLMSRVHAAQARLLAELARPARWEQAADLVTGMSGRLVANQDRPGSVDQELDIAEALLAGPAQRMAAAEAACAMGISPTAAARRVADAVELVTELPATAEALHDGLIDRAVAFMLADRTAVLDRAARSRVEDRILPLAHGRSRGWLRILTDRAVIIADPAAASKRHRHAVADRDVTCRPLPDGMGELTATLPAHDAHAVHTLLQILADTDPDHTRPVGARRADALTGIAETLLTCGRIDLSPLLNPQRPGTDIPIDQPSDQARPGWQNDHGSARPTPTPPTCSQDAPGDSGPVSKDPPRPAPPAPAPDRTASDPTASDRTASDPTASDRAAFDPTASDPTSTAPTSSAPTNTAPPPFRPPTRQGRPVDLVVTLSLSTLAGLDQLPGNLAGHGAITAEHACTLAAAARTITMLTLDPDTGTPTGISNRTYRPRPRLRDQARVLAERCTWPGCAQPSWRCDLDHRTPYDHQRPDRGGRTDMHNLDPQCRWHHLLKTHTDWTVTRHPDRTLTITTPAGLTHHYPPTAHTLPGEWTDQRNLANSDEKGTSVAGSDDLELLAVGGQAAHRESEDRATF